MTETVVTETGVEIPGLRLTTHMVVDRTLALYGPSRSGKTVIAKSILDLISGCVDQILVVSPTEPSNQSYVDYVPAQLIHYTMTAPDPKNPRKRITGGPGALAFLENVWQRQEMLTQTYKRANRVDTLAALFGRTSQRYRTSAASDIAAVDRLRQQSLKKITKKFRHDKAKLSEETKKHNEKFDEVRGKIYKKYIWGDINGVWQQRDKMTKDEQWALQYLGLNPKLVLIFDDCAAELKPLFNKPIFRKLFYQNRHQNLTVIFTFQDDTDLPTNLRKNAFISIFCNEVVCTSNFERPSNRYSKAIKKEVQEIAPTIYSKLYRKLAYIRDDPQGRFFYHFTAPTPMGKMFGSEAVQELCQALAADGSKIDEDNPYFKKFRL